MGKKAMARNRRARGMEEQLAGHPAAKELAQPVPQAPARDRGQNRNASRKDTNNEAGRNDAAFDPTQPANWRLPYRFVPLNDTIVPSPLAMAVIDHSRPLPDGVSGSLWVRWVAETPLCAGMPLPDDAAWRDDPRYAAQANEAPTVPFQLERDGRYVIPGSTLRGAVRAVFETASFARLSRINAHQRFGLRDFGEKESARARKDIAFKHYSDRVVRASPSAAYVEVVGQTADGRRRLYRLHLCRWRKIQITDILARYAATGVQGKDLGWWNRLDVRSKYRALRKIGLAGEVDLHSVGSGDGGPARLGLSEAGGGKGRIVVGGPAAGSPWKRKHEYVFLSPGEDIQEESIPIPDDPEGRNGVMDVFERLHSKQSKHGLEPDGTWARLGIANEGDETMRSQDRALQFGGACRFPVFYAGSPQTLRDCGGTHRPGLADEFAVGLTRLFKIPHKRTLGAVRDASATHGTRPKEPGGEERVRLDMAEALFGFVDEEDVRAGAGDDIPVGLRGRVSFGFATCEHAGWPNPEAKCGVLLGPRPSFAPFYLTGPVRSYSDDRARLAGRKRYPARGAAQSFPQGAADTSSTVFFLPATRRGADGETPLSFTGEIRFHNLSPIELGGLVWALTFGEPAGRFRHALGHGRPFGHGQMRAEIVMEKSRLRRHGQAKTEAPPDLDALMAPYRSYMERALGASDGEIATGRADRWSGSPVIRILRAIADPAVGSDRRSMLDAYMKDSKAYEAYSKVRDRYTVIAEAPAQDVEADTLLPPYPTR